MEEEWEKEFDKKWKLLELETEGMFYGVDLVGGTKHSVKLLIQALLEKQAEEYEKAFKELNILEYPRERKISAEQAWIAGQMNMLWRVKQAIKAKYGGEDK